jgi:putative endonuclease
MYHVYILKCSDDTFYIGSTQNLIARVQAHNNGRGAAHTFKHRPVVLVYSEEFATEKEAVYRERQIKRWSRDKKRRSGRRRSYEIKTAWRTRPSICSDGLAA